MTNWLLAVLSVVCAALCAALASHEDIIIVLMGRWPDMDVAKRRILRRTWMGLAAAWAILALLWLLIALHVLRSSTQG